MPTITLFKFDAKLEKNNIVKLLDKKKVGDDWIRARCSSYASDEIEVDYYYPESLEENLRRIVEDDQLHSILTDVFANVNHLIIRRVRIYINLRYNLLQVYRGPDVVTKRIKESLEKLLNVKLQQVTFSSSQLIGMATNYAEEIRHAIFKNVNGFWFTLLRGQHLEKNVKFQRYLSYNHNSLRAIGIRPKIRYIDGNKSFTVTINGDRGTLKICSSGMLKWRPRFELRQVIYIVSKYIGG